MTGHDELLERLRKATCGSRDFDADILLLTRVGWSSRQFGRWRGCLPKGDHGTERDYALDRAPQFTGSIDVAMMLIPNGWNYQLLHTSSLPSVSGKTHHASIKAPSEYGWTATPYWDGDANTLPLAICIASLRARSTPERG